MCYLEKYKQIADQNGFQFKDSNKDAIELFGGDNGNKVRTQYVVVEKDGVIYYAYDSYGGRMSCSYSGFYSIIHSAPSDLTCEINRRINPIMDRIILGKGQKIGNQFIDKHLFFKTKNIDVIRNFITTEVVDKYIKLKAKIPTTNILFGRGDDIFPRIKEHKDKIIVGIQSIDWIEPEKLLDTFNACSDILKRMPGIRKV